MEAISLVAVGVTLLAAVTHAMLQVVPGTLLLLYHASLGKHISDKTRSVVADYVSGVMVIVALMVATVCFVIQNLLAGGLSDEILIVMAGALAGLGIVSWLFYYKTGRTTELWIPRSLSRYISNRAQKTENNQEGFALGMLTAIAELPFSIILIIVTANNILLLPSYLRPLVVLLYAIITVAPSTVMRFAAKNGKTVVDIQKWRVKNKAFLKVMTGALFVTLAIVIIVFEVI